LLVALAFVFGTTAHAMPMPSVAKAGSAMAVMAHSADSSGCKGSTSDLGMNGRCLASCAPVFALLQPVSISGPIDTRSARARTSEFGATVAVKPDTSPPRT